MRHLIDVALSWGIAWNSDRWHAGPEWSGALAWNAHMQAMNIMAMEAAGE